MLNDGGQLFSYDKQENKATVLCLYESRILDNEVKHDYRAIVLKDNEEYLSSLESAKGYKDAIGGDDRFNVWKTTYGCEYITNGVLEKSIEPFMICKPKKKIADLKELTQEEIKPKYNEFATILRKHNISGHENAFDKLVNLFLAKIVDEQQNPDNLQFNWKGISQDSYFDLVDRLQKLYTVGMEKFLNEIVTYVSENDIVNSFRMRKDAAKDAILKYFKELKYFSNNDFTFLEVYNEKLFYQNSKVLIEVVQMLQDMKLRTDHQNQFLGDLFEGYLDNGVKQSEGQFFTPLPIVRFIVSSLPLAEINQQTDIPKVIDYACGSGHFLNEYAEEIKSLVPNDQLDDYYSEIYGIEKEYRLSKVTKVSSFMYGQDNINIIYGDALNQHEQIKDGKFSVIIANPPYSVKGFLETLPKKQRDTYELSAYVNELETNNNIELFFLERAKQLLKSEGVAGIIVPSTVLLSKNRIYIKARKMLLENFNIVAITKFGSQTFGKTGMDTVTLFLRKKKYPPKESSNYEYAIERWLNKSDDLSQDDIELVKNYCDYMGYDYDEYLELQSKQLDRIFNIELFREYEENFVKDQTAKKISNKKTTNKYTKEMKQNEVKQKVKYICNIEKEKLIYYSLANSQKIPVVIVKSPKKAEEAQNFLGYKWSGRKGSEGIQYISTKMSNTELKISKKQAINSIQTPLFNPVELDDSSKINSVIRNNFNGILDDIPDALTKYVLKIKLTDMLDFNQTLFDAEIDIDAQTNPIKNLKINSKYPIKKLGNKDNNVEILKGSHITKTTAGVGTIKVVAGGIDFAYTTNKPNRPKNIITVSASGASAGFVNYWDEPIFASDCTTIKKGNHSQLKTLYIFRYLKYMQNEIYKLARGSAQPHVYPEDLKKFPIPVPPLEIQDKIIKKTDQLDQQYQNSRMKIEEYRKRIQKIFENLDVIGGGETYKLSSNIFSLSIGKRVLDTELTDDGIPVYSANVYKPFGFINKDLLHDFSKPSIIWGIDGDWMVNVISEKTPFYPTYHTGVLRVNDNSKVNYRYLAHKLEQLGQQEGYSRSKRASMGALKKLSVVVPNIKQQNSAMSKVETLEKRIYSEKQKMKEIQLEKTKIVGKFLN